MLDHDAVTRHVDLPSHATGLINLPLSVTTESM